jgi:hypothetical protein
MASGALGEAPRDAAVHASVCEGCLGLVAAHDALAAIDTGLAALPPTRLAQRRPPTPILGAARVAAATLTVGVLGAALAFGASQLIGGGRQPAARAPAPTAAGAVLGAQGAPPESEGTATPRPTPTRTPRASVSPSPTAALTPSAGEAPPALPPPPIGIVAALPSSTPTPSPTGSPTAPPTPSPTPPPTPTPSPTASPTATPSPTPIPQCSDGVDNDGDGLTDYGLDPLVNDPQCSSPADNDEAS